MLNILDDNIKVMPNPKKLKLSIHRSNLFHPRHLGIKKVVRSIDMDQIAVIKSFTKREYNKNAEYPTVIEIQEAQDHQCAYVLKTLYSYENVTGLAWLDSFHIITVSKEQNISIYDIQTGAVIFSIISDYGPITCLQYSSVDKALFVGSEYGFISVYRVNAKTKRIEFVSKMVKSNEKITAIGIYKRSKLSIQNPRVTSLPKIAPGKRKRGDSSEESSDDDIEETKEFLSDLDITIYGASLGNVIVWDYHKKAITDTIRVSGVSVPAILALNNGNLLTGDTNGVLCLFDHNSLTCRQSTKLLSGGITCMAKSFTDKSIIVSGKESTIAILNPREDAPDELVLFEKIQAQSPDVTTLEFMNKRRFFVGSSDGLLTCFKIKNKRNDRKVEISRTITLPDYRSNIRFHDKEMMIQNDNTLVVWQLPRANFTSPKKSLKNHDQQSTPEPTKKLLLKTKAFIHSSTFSNKWICYSSKKDVYPYERDGDKIIPHRLSEKVTDNCLLELCFNDSYLAIGIEKKVCLVDLRKKNTKSEECETENKKTDKLKIVSTFHMTKQILRLNFIQTMDLLLVTCGQSNSIYMIGLDPADSSGHPIQLRKFNIVAERVLFIDYNRTNKRDRCIYLCTSAGKLIKFDPGQDSSEDINARIKEQSVIEGVHKYHDLKGMVVVSKDCCLLYNNYLIFRADLNSNRVISRNADYNYILKMNNDVFGEKDHVSLAELTPADYLSLLPPMKSKKKFGT